MAHPQTQTNGDETYREPKVEEDDDDLDDLDDVLASFNSQPIPTPPPASVPPVTHDSDAKARTAADQGEDDEDFEASLAQGMESLLRQLAGDHPPGPMPDTANSFAAAAGGNINGAASSGSGGMSKEEEEAAWQKALELVLSGEGLAAMGLDEDAVKQESSIPTSASGTKGKERAFASTSTSKPTPKPTFEETMRRTLDSLNTAGQKPNSNSQATGGGGGDADLEALLKSIGGDPDLLKSLNLGEEDGEDGLADVLEGMMAQLMTREVLEEPMSELATKYPPYLASPPSDISKSDLEKYTKQNTIVQKILDVYKRKDYSDEKDGKEVAKLVGEMQDLGGPPKDVMGDLPEGFDLGALGALGGDDCIIM